MGEQRKRRLIGQANKGKEEIGLFLLGVFVHDYSTECTNDT
jgi:hypothetical protein